MRHLLPILVTFAVLLGSAGVSGSADFQKGLDAAKRGDWATTLREWKPLAEQGNAPAQYNLANMYKNGKGVPQDYKTAVKWYTIAAKQGDADAQHNLGWMHHNGQGVPHDEKKAMMWWNLAAKQGHDYAQDLIETCRTVYNPKGNSGSDKYIGEWDTGVWCGQFSTELPPPAHHAPLDVTVGMSYDTFSKGLVDKGWRSLWGNIMHRRDRGYRGVQTDYLLGTYGSVIDCSGEPLPSCKFIFTDVYNNKLIVITDAARWQEGVPNVKKFWFEVTTEFPRLSKHAPLPVKIGLRYDVFRKRLIEKGWKPFKSRNKNNTSYSPYSKFNWVEEEYCSPTGLSKCRFAFVDDYKNTLAVITVGENPEGDPPPVAGFWLFKSDAVTKGE